MKTPYIADGHGSLIRGIIIIYTYIHIYIYNIILRISQIPNGHGKKGHLSPLQKKKNWGKKRGNNSWATGILIPVIPCGGSARRLTRRAARNAHPPRAPARSHSASACRPSQRCRNSAASALGARRSELGAPSAELCPFRRVGFPVSGGQNTPCAHGHPGRLSVLCVCALGDPK